MSIHLNAFQPRETNIGVSFSADINGHHVECLITYQALSELNKGSRASALQLFRVMWPQIRDKAVERIQSRQFPVNQPLVLRRGDFHTQPISGRLLAFS